MKDSDKQTLDITIKTTQGTWHNSFPKTAKVSEVIAATVQHFHFALDGKYELRLENDPNNALKPERTLVSFGIKDEDVLIFTDLGGAV